MKIFKNVVTVLVLLVVVFGFNTKKKNAAKQEKVFEKSVVIELEEKAGRRLNAKITVEFVAGTSDFTKELFRGATMIHGFTVISYSSCGVNSNTEIWVVSYISEPDFNVLVSNYNNDTPISGIDLEDEDGPIADPDGFGVVYSGLSIQFRYGISC